MLKSLKAAILWLCVVCASAVTAVEVPTLFTAEVPFDREAEDPRAQAYRAALLEVLTRVSGSAFAADTLLVEELFPEPEAYVVQFRPGAQDTLWVSFDGEAVQQTLRAAGQTVWGSDRPLTLIWLAVDWGQGEREIIAADDPDRSLDETRSINRNRLLRERLLDFAERRGLPIAFPLLDTEDLQKVGFSDIWGGFDELVLDASGRYEAGSVLIGRIRPGSTQRTRWTYHFGGEDRVWNGGPEFALAQVAELLASEFAIGGDAPLRTVDLAVSGIVTVDHYGEVQNLLAGITLIENVSIIQVEGDRIVYSVEAHGGAERLARALRFGGLIEQTEEFEDADVSIDQPVVDPPMNRALEFYYSP